MKERFELPIGKLITKKGKIYQEGYRMHLPYGCVKRVEIHIEKEIDPEALKEWLDEATTPRFHVKYDPVGYLVIDSENKYSIANFKNCEHIDAEKEAQHLADRLNEKDGK